jgi:hypothetical protein
LPSGFEDYHLATFGEEINLAVGRHGRSGKNASNSFLPNTFSRFTIDATNDSDPIGHIDQAFVVNHRGHIGCPRFDSPLDVCRGDVAFASRF